MSYILPVILEDYTRVRLNALKCSRKQATILMVKEAIDQWLDREEQKEQLKAALSSAANHDGTKRIINTAQCI